MTEGNATQPGTSATGTLDSEPSGPSSELALTDARTLAAVDLGSNSFHMVLGRAVDGQPAIIGRMKEMVQLGIGLDAERQLGEAAQERALACLSRFGQYIRSLPHDNVRAVGTNALRVARNVDGFLARAALALGHPIEVISGIEEARLIYAGVLRDRTAKDERLLVVDIGGGSTELVIGEREPLELESLYVGSITMMQRHFEDGKLSAKRFRRAEMTASQELEVVQERFRRLGWRAAVGASGTVRAVARVLRARSWSDGAITPGALAQLRDEVIAAGSVERLTLEGLSRSRANVFPGGLAVLSAILEMLGVQRLEVSQSALREGLLDDLMGRVLRRDVRSLTVDHLMQRYHVEKHQASRVESTLFDLVHQVSEAWNLPPVRSHELGSWAARLHEIGRDVAHSHYHKHGAYIITYADMPGFSRQEQRQLAALVRAHRRKFPSALFREIPDSERLLEHLALLLRLAVLLHRSRGEAARPELVPGRRALELRFAPGWLERHPLTHADLLEEAELLRAAGFELRVPVMTSV
jgi:exopolyphosphatase / guanosine-5'-triphosphate,3'-diphosphate pyrophosphatase